MIRAFLIALQFLTRMPVRLQGPLHPKELGASLPYYPLVGLVLGGFMTSIAWLLEDVPGPLRAALVLLAWVGLTGALHLDGLADTVDAWAGGRGDRARTLSLLKDPCCGPMGVTAVVLALLLKFAALLASFEQGDLATLGLAAFLGRTSLPLLFLTTPYVRPSGLGAAMAQHLPRRTTGWAVLLADGSLLGLFGGVGVAALLGALGTFAVWRAALLRRIGGTTGDTAGALVELTEVAVLIGVSLVR